MEMAKLDPKASRHLGTRLFDFFFKGAIFLTSLLLTRILLTKMELQPELRGINCPLQPTQADGAA
jgi:hypothetical protein